MFSGIVEELGIVKGISHRTTTLLEVAAEKVLEGTKKGDSIAVNGVCLTVVAKTSGSVNFEIMNTTLKGTNLGLLRINQKVNLERSLKLGDRVSGHFVTGHIDCLGIVRSKRLRQGAIEFEVAVKPEFSRYLLPKGSICLDGISLTLAKVSAGLFTVGIIPHTLKNTTLDSKGPSDKLNVEFDILTKRSIH